MFRLVAAAMAIDNQRRRFVPRNGRPSASTTRHGKRNRLHDSACCDASLIPRWRYWRFQTPFPLSHRRNCRLDRFIQTAAIPQYFNISRRRLDRCIYFIASLRGVPSEVGLRCVPVRNIHASFANPDWPNQQIDRSLEKNAGWFPSMRWGREIETPHPPRKNPAPPGPFHEKEEDKPGKKSSGYRRHAGICSTRIHARDHYTAFM